MSQTRQPAVTRFPKVKSPFERSEDEDGYYTVDPEIQDGFEWVFESDDVIAVEKLHGTNCAVQIEWTEEGVDLTGWTRHGTEAMQPVDPYGTRTHQLLCRAFQNSYERGYLDDLEDGVHYGEVVGPDFHGNAHELDVNLFIPFSWLEDKCSYTSWGKYPKTYEAIREWFATELFSLFYNRMHGVSLDDASVSEGTFCEGIIFLHPDGGYAEETLDPVEEALSGGRYRKVSSRMAKLRRDMFSEYQHGEWPTFDEVDH